MPMLVTKKCPFTGASNVMELDITEEQIKDWKSGTLVQDAFPQLNADEREFLMTGITPEVWEKTFGSEAEREELGGLVEPSPKGTGPNG